MSRRAVGLLFAIALLCRLAYAVALWHVLPIWNVDALGYHNIAVNLIQRGTFSLDAVPPFQPDAVRTPGYPAFIALIYAAFGEAPRAVIVAQAVVDSVTALLVMGIALRLLGNDQRKARTAWLAGAIYALYPTAWHYAFELYVETVLALTLALFFYIALRPSRWQPVWLGLVCSVNLLIKPNVILLPLIGLAILWGQSTHTSRQPHENRGVSGVLRAATLFACAVAALLLPWVVRNARIFGRPMLSTVFEFNLAYVSAPFTLAEARGQPIGIWSAEFEALYGEVYEQAKLRDPALFAIPVRQMTPEQTDRHQRVLAEVAGGIIRAHPGAFVASQFSQVARTWLPYDHQLWFTHLTGKNWNETIPEPFLNTWASGQTVSRVAVALFFAFHGLYAAGLIATLIGAWRLLRISSTSTRVVILVMAAMIVYMTILPGPIGYERFRVPVMPLVCALMAGAFMPRRAWCVGKP
jgi:hypothetical protein